jgi:IS30 family transposase
MDPEISCHALVPRLKCASPCGTLRRLSPWQRGSNENTNGLLRQYLPKKADLSGYIQSDLDRIALRLNQRPRKMSGFETPESRLQASVASTP